MSNSGNAFAAAKRAKKDEFYTMYGDIDEEVIHYKEHFHGKTVYCNCDTKNSNFVKYFQDHFNEFGLKDLVYSSIQDGIDFRSEKSIGLLKKSDIVISNPPFSLFREYVKQLVDYQKQFLIIGAIGAASYKNIFGLLKNDKIWLGYKSGDMLFEVPNEEPYISKKSYNAEQGVCSFGNICWFTNLDIEKRHKDINLFENYYKNESKYPRYDNYDAIEVGRVKNIPKDYDGVMGVPITFMVQYNPHQFEILGGAEQMGKGLSCGLWNEKSESPYPLIGGKKKYARVFIRKRYTTGGNES